MTAKRHHLLPEFYLKRWADKNDRVRVVDLHDSRSFSTNTCNAVVQSNFYAVETNDGSPTDIIESALAELEGFCAKGFAAIDSGEWPLNHDHRSALAHFIAIQLLRGEKFRTTMEEATNEFGKLVAMTLAEHPEALRRRMCRPGAPEPSDDEVRQQADFMLAGNYTIREPQNALVQRFLETAAEMVDPVFSCSWDLLTAAAEERFVTADEPVRMWRRPGLGPAWQGVGILTADDITLPLDPRRCLRLSIRLGRPDREFGVDGQTVAVVNERTAHGAHRFLVTSPSWHPGVKAPSNHGLGLPTDVSP